MIYKALAFAAMVASASAFAPAARTRASRAARMSLQDFLEAEPYWDQSTIPVNTYKTKSPFIG
eukprot:CAMPEP_0118886482 /NCGR_PEP_ID=MMETSP1163-20130328/24552_1 /TAXON_ID=124430 /ORGANISM="Phaeomonas parva, Strain CCMP2877" /LENGTH=62 /DNA_ID=CAMNT_0006824707 /DNA_START=27 /DNA_END=212 /DNA_ORIENTATION=-